MKKPCSGFAILCCFVATYLGSAEMGMAQEKTVNPLQPLEAIAKTESDSSDEIPLTLVWQLKEEAQRRDRANYESFFSNPNDVFKGKEIAVKDIPSTLENSSLAEIKIQESLTIQNSGDLQRNTTYRVGVSQDLTVGIGVTDEGASLGLAKILPESTMWQYPTSPIATTRDHLDFNVNVNFQPSSQFGFKFDGNRLSSRLGIKWQPLPGVTLSSTRNSRDESLTTEIQINQKIDALSLSAHGSRDNKDNWRWGVASNVGELKLSYQSNGNKNSLRSNSEISYKLLGETNQPTEILVQVNHETRDTKEDSDRLTTVRVNYSLGEKSADGKHRWQFNLGYGFGSQGNGAIASVSTNAIEGLTLRASYQSISLTSNDTSFKIELLPLKF